MLNWGTHTQGGRVTAGAPKGFVPLRSNDVEARHRAHGRMAPASKPLQSSAGLALACPFKVTSRV